MAEYLDSGSSDPTQCLGYWFDQNVVAGITGFHVQFGYYSYKALYPFGEILKATATAGNPVHLVLGSNKGTLREVDLRWICDLIDGAADASLSVVSFGNAEFHPKTVCLQRADGTLAGIVGSSNLTKAGLGRNVEAMISIDSATDGQVVCQQIIDAVRRWGGGGDGVYPITSSRDIDDLKAAKLINVPQPPVTRPGRARGAVPNVKNPGTRSSLWLPPTRPPTPTAPPPPVIPPQPTGTTPTQPQPAATIPADHGPVLWEKTLAASDCERQPGHGTGGVRLTQARFQGPDGSVIDQTTYFHELFDQFDWSTTKVEPYTEDADIPIHLVVKGIDFRVRNMTVSHKPTGEAGQGNYTTILKWSGIVAEIRALDLRGLTLTLYGPAPATTEPYFIEVA